MPLSHYCSAMEDEKSQGSLKILIVDDHAVVRDGIKRLLDEHLHQVAYGETNNSEQALELARKREWDLLILDLTLGERSGMVLLKDIKQVRPTLPVLVLTIHNGEQFARRAFQNGASGYITKDSPRFELLEGIQRVLEGGHYACSSVAGHLLAGVGRQDQPAHAALSDREFEVLRLLASGNTVGEIAVMLSLSSKTISTYRARILQKMGMRTNAALMRYALDNRLV